MKLLLVLGQGAGVLPKEDQVKEGQINVILSDSDPHKVFDGTPLKSSWWLKRDLKNGIPFRGRHGENHEGRQGRPAAFGQVCLLSCFFMRCAYRPVFVEFLCWKSLTLVPSLQLSERSLHTDARQKCVYGVRTSFLCETIVVHQVCREKGSYREALSRGNQRQAFQVEN